MKMANFSYFCYLVASFEFLEKNLRILKLRVFQGADSEDSESWLAPFW